MLEIGTFRQRHCGGVSRRAFLKAGGSVPLALGLPQLAWAVPTAPKANSVLVVFLLGGPSHLDMFDPKPHGPAEYRGPFSPVATRTAGVHFSELLPKLAGMSDRFSLVRSNVNFSGDHLVAMSIGMTGADEGPGGHPPNFGSILARQRSTGGLPSFISLARGPIGDGRGPAKGYGGGTWGKAYDPFMVRCDQRGDVEIPSLKLLEGLNIARLDDRKLLLSQLDQLRRRGEGPQFEQWQTLHQRAYSLLTSGEARRAFDLSQENLKTREAYGYTSFGQSCLLGRRLVEAGVPYVQVNWSQYVEVFYPFSDYGWDTHADNFELLADWHCPLLDGAFSTLLSDLAERGLLETTLVVCLGEFGRTPRINGIGSRDHWHQCYFSLWAGGGVQPGRTIGQSDPRGEYPITEPVTPARMGATIAELAGITSARRVELGVLQGARAVEELL